MLVDDDRDLVDIVHFALRRAGFEVLVAYDSPMALKHLDQNDPDLVVVDINLGAYDGFDLLKQLRQRSKIPIIVLSARDREEDKICGLELGADDYITKPFSHGEFLARIRAHIRRTAEGWAPPEQRNGQPTNGQLQAGPIVINPAQHLVLKHGQRLNLTVTEYRLLHYLMINVGSILSSQAIAKHVWGYDDTSANEIVRVTVYRLRKKLEDDPANPQFLQTIPGVGIVLNAEA